MINIYSFTRIQTNYCFINSSAIFYIVLLQNGLHIHQSTSIYANWDRKGCAIIHHLVEALVQYLVGGDHQSVDI